VVSPHAGWQDWERSKCAGKQTACSRGWKDTVQEDACVSAPLVLVGEVIGQLSGACQQKAEVRCRIEGVDEIVFLEPSVSARPAGLVGAIEAAVLRIETDVTEAHRLVAVDAMHRERHGTVGSATVPHDETSSDRLGIHQDVFDRVYPFCVIAPPSLALLRQSHQDR
jgi:hypothetical protein